ncbi:MAG TPA: hypothetical protein PKC44_12720, partial [Agitococcus sp.]|nr:hypothetical protein [Agitococcus sp.]
MTNLLKLGDIIFHKKGNAFKSTDFREVGVPVVRVTDFTQDGIDSKNVVYVDNETAEENEDVKLFTNDILIQTVGSWPNNPASVVGKVVRVPKELNNSLL